MMSVSHDLGVVDHDGIAVNFHHKRIAFSGAQRHGLHISGFNRVTDMDVIQQNLFQLFLVLWLQQIIDGALGQLVEGFVRRGKHREWARAIKGVDETGRLDGG